MKLEAFASSAVETPRREEICNAPRPALRSRSLERLAVADAPSADPSRAVRETPELTDSERRGLLLASEKFSVAVTPHFAALIDPDDPGCPIRRQVVPQDERAAGEPGRHDRPLRRGRRLGGRGARAPLSGPRALPRARHLRRLLPLLHPQPAGEPGRARAAGPPHRGGARLSAGAHRGARRAALRRRSAADVRLHARPAPGPAAGHPAHRVPAHRHAHPRLPAAAHHAGAGERAAQAPRLALASTSATPRS